MAAGKPTDPIEFEPADETDVPVYLPGTPTLGFTRFLERFYDEFVR
ncbi:hypothetical protein [Natronorubrum aibiense]|nr:hypothetical protein [Natronorubrum aibiense]